MRRIIDVLSHLVGADERDAVLGDIEESGESGARAVLDLLGLIVRRQMAMWKSWWPWLALVGLAIPFGLLLSQLVQRLSGSSAIYAWLYLNNWTMTYLENSGFRLDLFKDAGVFALEYTAVVLWSLALGYAVGYLSRSVAWMNATVFCFLLFAEVMRAPQHEYGDNAAAFESAFYRVALPVILRIVLVMIPFTAGAYRKAVKP